MARLNYILACLILFTHFCQKAQGQSGLTGFYIVLDKKTDCVNPFKSLIAITPLCLSKNPIVTETDFESVSNIHVDSIQSTKYVNLKISKDAYGRIQLLARKLPKITLVLVIDGTIVGIIENPGTIGNPIPIYSNLHSTEVEWVYDKLKKLKNLDKP